MVAVLDAHADVVHCMRALPDGSLATAGGKHDGKIRVWSRAQCAAADEATPADATIPASRSAEEEAAGGGAAPEAAGSSAAAPAAAAAPLAELDASSGPRAVAPALPLVEREASQTLREPGYVFDLAVLPDAQPGSELFALACARYNVVKICV